MNRIFRHKYTIFSLMAAMAMLMVSATGCIMDNEEPGTPDDEGLMMVSFRVVTPNQTAASRGVTPPTGTNTWDDAYDSAEGSDFDNMLLRDQFKVIITDNACNVKANVQNLYCVTTTTQDGASKTYDFLGVINDANFDDVQQLADGKLHVIANAGNNATLADGTAFAKYGQGLDAIPMWGVHTVTNFKTMKKGERFDAGDVWLLRAMAKVEIKLAEGTDNYINGLTSATLEGVNGSGYLLPVGSTAENPIWKTVSETKALSYDDSFRPNPATSVNIDAKSQDDKTIVFYLPECINQATAQDKELAINVSYTTKETPEGGQPETGTIYFRPYDTTTGKPTDGQPYNIVRNHLYRFTITGIDPNREFTLNWTVCPMDNLSATIPPFN